MTSKEIAEITAQIVVSVVESGRTSIAKEDVVKYYASIFAQIVTSANEYEASRTAKLNSSSNI